MQLVSTVDIVDAQRQARTIDLAEMARAFSRETSAADLASVCSGMWALESNKSAVVVYFEDVAQFGRFYSRPDVDANGE